MRLDRIVNIRLYYISSLRSRPSMPRHFLWIQLNQIGRVLNQIELLGRVLVDLSFKVLEMVVVFYKLVKVGFSWRWHLARRVHLLLQHPLRIWVDLRHLLIVETANLVDCIVGVSAALSWFDDRLLLYNRVTQNWWLTHPAIHTLSWPILQLMGRTKMASVVINIYFKFPIVLCILLHDWQFVNLSCDIAFSAVKQRCLHSVLTSRHLWHWRNTLFALFRRSWSWLFNRTEKLHWHDSYCVI